MEKFCKMPKPVLCRTDLTSTEKLIVCNLMDRSGNNRVAWPGYDCIGKDLGLSKSAVLRAVTLLEQKGILVIERNNGLSNRYRIATGSETLPVSKRHLNRCRNATTASSETLPELDQLNYTQRTRPTKSKIDTSKTQGEGFEKFWNAYPRKTAKAAARKAWQKIKLSPELLETILKAIENQRQSDQWIKDSGKFIPYPATWLNGQRWTDELPTTPGGEDEVDWGETYHKSFGPDRNLPDDVYQELLKQDSK
jgi:biotin operon repressor